MVMAHGQIRQALALVTLKGTRKQAVRLAALLHDADDSLLKGFACRAEPREALQRRCTECAADHGKLRS